MNREAILKRFNEPTGDYPDNAILSFIANEKELIFYMPECTDKIYYVKEISEEIESTGILEDDLDSLYEWLHS